MTVVELTDKVMSYRPKWSAGFTRDEIQHAVSEARELLHLEDFVAVPRSQIPAVLAKTAVALNRRYPDRMAEALDGGSNAGDGSA
mgnify:FL=1